MNSTFGDFGPFGLALPIAQRGLFFQDAYFQRAREHFEASVMDVLAMFGLQQLAFADSLQRYRGLRFDNPRQETQVVTAVEEDHNYKMLLDVRDFMGGELKVTIVGDNELLVEGKVERKNQGTLQTRTFRQRFLLPNGVHIQESSSALSSDGVLTIITPKVVQHHQSIQQQSRQIPIQMMRPRSIHPNSHFDRNNYSISDTEFNSGMLPILRRGYFNQDSSFQDSQNDFQRAVNDVLARSGMQSADPFTSYRSLRDKNLKPDTQAATLSEDDQAQKIVIDVQDFINDGEVSVKLVNGEDLVVEGKVEKKDGAEKSMKNFKKEFTLSPNAELDSITSFVSADGVLVITVPKKVPKIRERIIPLMREGQQFSGASTPANFDMLSQNRDSCYPTDFTDSENEKLYGDTPSHGQATMVDASTSPEPSFSPTLASMVTTPSATPVNLISCSPSISPPILLTPTPTPPASPPPVFYSAPTPMVMPPAPPSPILLPPAPPSPIVLPPSPPPIVHRKKWKPPVKEPEIQEVIEQPKDTKTSESGPMRFPRAHGYVPVVKKGDFEADPHFENDKPEYDSAIKTALKCKGTEVEPGEEMATYKKMREENPDADENVAFSFTQHNQGYKIVLDLEGYNVKDPEIQIQGDNDIFIVGVAERKDEDGEPLHFRRQFIFPKSINMAVLTSAVSANGVLTIKAPFKVARAKETISEPPDLIEDDSIESGVNLNMLVGKFLDIVNCPETFDKDPMFHEPKCHFPSAIRAAIKRSGVNMEPGETEAQCYRRLRNNERRHQTQAVMTIEGVDYYKVVVDMEDYMNTDIKVRLLGFNTFVVECYQDKFGKYRIMWSRQFVLPNHILMEKMTSTLSKDGKLVMNVPKRVWKPVASTDSSGIMRVGWSKTYPDERVFTSDSCKSGVTIPCKTLPYKGLRDW
ncbi:unnamed protein product, partial [Meganyctiphanes norvegica]